MTNEDIINLIQQGVDVNGNLKLLYQQNERFIQKLVNRYAASEQDKDDLMQEAFFGLYEACNKYQNSQGVKFITYAGYWIKQAVIRYIKANGKTIKLPEYLHERIRKYKKGVSLCTMQLGRKPTDRELCRYLKINSGMLQELKKTIHEYDSIQSLDTPLSDEEDSFLSDIVQGTENIENKVIDEIMSKDGALELWQLVRENTSDLENEVLINRYKKSMTYKQIGADIGKTCEGARHIENKAIKKLRRPTVSRRIKEALDLNYDLAYRGNLSSFRYTWTSSTESVAMHNIETIEHFTGLNTRNVTG